MENWKVISSLTQISVLRLLDFPIDFLHLFVHYDFKDSLEKCCTDMLEVQKPKSKYRALKHNTNVLMHQISGSNHGSDVQVNTFP